MRRTVKYWKERMLSYKLRMKALKNFAIATTIDHDSASNMITLKRLGSNISCIFQLYLITMSQCLEMFVFQMKSFIA